MRPVPPSALPPDLRWAADDPAGDLTGGTVSSPFSGVTHLGPGMGPGMGPGLMPGRGGPGDGEIAAHVAAMSPEARNAVQATVGNGGGWVAGHGAGRGDDIGHRGRLISFLSSVR